MAVPAWLAALGVKEGLGTFDRTLESARGTAELERRGVDMPWWQKALPYLAGPIIGSRITEHQVQSKLARTEPGIPTRQSAGLGGDEALLTSSRAYQDMLRRQMGMEISSINREFGAAGRFTSGQRGAAIQEAQQGGRQAFSDAFAKMALQKYLSGEDIASRERIAQAQLEAQSGMGRTQLTGSILQSLALIFASNPEWLGKIGGGIKSGASSIGGFFQGGGEEELLKQKEYLPTLYEPDYFA